LRALARALDLWLAIYLMVSSLAPGVSLLAGRRHHGADDCGCPVSCACRAEGCCTCRSQLVSVQSRCACAGSNALADALHGRWEMLPGAAPRIEKPHPGRPNPTTLSGSAGWLVAFELDHPPRPSDAAA
jgi:hypothetical protein